MFAINNKSLKYQRRCPPQLSKRISGYLLIELSLYLIVATILLLSQTAKINEALEKSLAVGTGQYMVELQGAVNRYQTENDSALKNAAAIVGFAIPLRPTIAELIAANYLPPGFGGISPLGLTFANELTLTGCPGPACVINGLTYSTTGYRDLGNIIRTDLLGVAVSQVGVDAGQSMPDSPTLITGFAGSFTAANPILNVVGVLAVRTGDSSGLNVLLSQFYKLDGSRRLTGTMNANNNDINNVKDLLSTGVLTMNDGVVNGSILLNGSAAAGAACLIADSGKITKNATGDGLVICNNNLWQAVGSAVSGISAGGACATPNQLGTSATGIAFVCNGSFWNSLSNFASVGDVCAPSGRTASSSSNNEELICRNGQYMRLNSLLPRNIQVGPHFPVQDGAIVAKPTCDVGGVANYTLGLTQTGVDVSIAPPYQSTYVAAVNNGTSWTILLRLKRSPADGGGEVSGTAYGLSAVMTLECAY